MTAGSEQSALGTLIANGDVYKEVGTTITLIEKGSSDTWASGNKYYTVVGSVAAKDMAVNKIYVYGEADEGGKAGFRYIGKLSENKETWSEADLSKIVIKYDIAGVTGTRYGEVEDDCAYGLYKEVSTEVNGTKLAKGDGTAISGAAAIATRLKGTAATQFQFDATQVDLTGLEVTKIVIDSNEYEFTSSANTASGATTVSDGKLYTIKNFTASTVAKIQFYYGDATGGKYIVTWTIS